jgi:hypothetical protein
MLSEFYFNFLIFTLILILFLIFIPFVTQPFLFLCILLYFTGKIASKIFRKVCRKELHLLLSLSI